MNLDIQATEAKPTIENFVICLQAGVNAWEAAGRILVALRREEPDIFKRIVLAHSWITLDSLEVFHSIGLRTFYPMVALLPRNVYNRVRAMPYEIQKKVCVEPIEIVTRMVGDKPVVIRKPVTQLTHAEASRALWRKGNYTVAHQVKQLESPKFKSIQEMLPKNTHPVTSRSPKEVARFAVSRGGGGTWKFLPTMASSWNSQNVRLESGQAVIVLQEFVKDQE